MNYVGSQGSMLRFIQSIIKKYTQNKYNTIYDLFAGSGVISQAYRRLGYTVIANDIEYYSYVYNYNLVHNTKNVDINLARFLNLLEPVEGFIYNNYCLGSGSGRSYLTDVNGKKVDAIRIKLEETYKNGEIDQDTYFFYLASLIESVDKVANVAMNYGTFLKSFKPSAKRQFKFQLLPFVNGPVGTAYNRDANELINDIEGDILYLDPPHNGRQYGTNYHFLNTIAKYDSPELNNDVAGTRKDGYKSPYSMRKYAPDVLEDLISKAKFKYIFLTYNSGGTINVKKIEEIMSKYGEYHCEVRDEKQYIQDKKANAYNKRAAGDECVHVLIKG